MYASIKTSPVASSWAMTGISSILSKFGLFTLRECLWTKLTAGPRGALLGLPRNRNSCERAKLAAWQDGHQRRRGGSRRPLWQVIRGGSLGGLFRRQCSLSANPSQLEPEGDRHVAPASRR